VRSWKAAVAVLGVAVVVAASFVTPKAFDSSPAAGHDHGGQAMGAGLAPGATVPEFSERDVKTGASITSATLQGRRTLLFFSEGVMCQACLQQIKELDGVQAQLDTRGIRLVSITPDSSDELRQAIGDYAIRSPMIADGDRDMSSAFNTLGQGMHGDTPGHAFVLIDGGKVVWYRDYWLPPSRTMFVEPSQLLADLPV
jgi:peroxiredoxin Q/BCP